MKKRCVIVLFVIVTLNTKNARGQDFEIQQLLLNVEKLAQFKSMLEDLKKGYDIVFKGYSTIKNISEGNFNLHQAFLDGLLQVSPSVQNYFKVSWIIKSSVGLTKEYARAIRNFQTSKLLSQEELRQVQTIYYSLLQKSLSQLEALANVLTTGKLRMSDDERLSAIDDLDKESKDQYLFFEHFIGQTNLLLLQRAKENKDVKTSRKIQGVSN